MAILQAIFAALAHSTGKIANLAFAWATTMLFGKVPDDRQIYLSGICLLSFIWLVLAIGVVFPVVGTFLLTFVTFDWLSKSLLRMIMLAGVLVLPLVSGIVSIFLLEPSHRPQGIKGKLVMVAKGYPLTLGLALTLLMLVFIAPVIKAKDAIKRWQTAHVAVQILPEDYRAVLEQAKRTLQSHGVKYSVKQSSFLMRLPMKLLTALSGSTFSSFVSDDLTTLALENGEISVYPADIVVSAPKKTSGQLQATLVKGLAFGKAKFTWTKDAQHYEDLLNELRMAYMSGKLSFEDLEYQLTGITKSLDATNLDFQEWQTVYRELLMLQQQVLEQRDGALWLKRQSAA